MDNFLTKQVPFVLVQIHLLAAQAILQTNGIVYYGLVLQDLPPVEHGGLLKMLKKYNVAFPVNRSIDPDHIGSKVPSFSVIYRGSPPYHTRRKM